MRITTLVLTTAALALPLTSCSWSGGPAARTQVAECNPDCSARCRVDCTGSGDSSGYDECVQGCRCGCE